MDKDNMGASASPKPALVASDGAASRLHPAGFDPARVRAWLVGMTKQGEDRIWRGAQEALRLFDATLAPNAARWCWTEDDPEMTYPSPREWLEYAAPWVDQPFVQRFDWGIAGPSTWAVFHEDGWPPRVEEFATAEDAETRRFELAASVDRSGEAGETRSEAEGLDPKGESAVPSDSEGDAQK
jgi:hypothetical protein